MFRLDSNLRLCRRVFTLRSRTTGASWCCLPPNIDSSLHLSVSRHLLEGSDLHLPGSLKWRYGCDQPNSFGERVILGNVDRHRPFDKRADLGDVDQSYLQRGYRLGQQTVFIRFDPKICRAVGRLCRELRRRDRIHSSDCDQPGPVLRHSCVGI